jgi:hypothetical protein
VSTLELSCFALTALLQLGTFTIMVWMGERSLRTVDQSDVGLAHSSIDNDLAIARAGIELTHISTPLYRKVA